MGNSFAPISHCYRYEVALEFESTAPYVGYRLSRLGDVVVNVVLSHFFGDAIKDLGAVLDNAVKPGCLSRA
jgi:hypothetical protein